MPDELESLRVRAVDGDSEALGQLIESLSDGVFLIARRMLWDHGEAEDATQDILTKVVTKLTTFEGRSSLKTWVYRIAVNHLLDRRRLDVEALTFDLLAADLVDGLEDPSPDYQPELDLMAHEVMVTCTGAMLLCLDRDHRVAYLLGELLQIPGPTAAIIAGIDPTTLRKRLQRARADIRAFMSANCGLASNEAPCRCTRRVNRATELGRIGINTPVDRQRSEQAVKEITALSDTDQIMRAALSATPSPQPAERLQQLLSSSTALFGRP